MMDIKEIARDVLNGLRDKYPVFVSGLPLKIGIYADIAEALGAHRDMELKIIRVAMSMHCGSPEYRWRIASGGIRYALDGSAAGSVSDIDAMMAARYLSESDASRAEKAERRERQIIKERQAKRKRERELARKARRAAEKAALFLE